MTLLAVRAEGALRSFQEAEILDLADVQVAMRLGRLGGETDGDVLLALALAVRAVRGGSVALRLRRVAETVEDVEGLPWPAADAWVDAVSRSPLAAPGGPLRVQGDTIWLDRYWRLEELVASKLLRRWDVAPDVDEPALAAALARLWPGAAPAEQRVAAAVCATSTVSVLGGSPGTGKTTTVAKLLAALRASSSAPPRVALAAPTAKAAARLVEAIGEAVSVGDVLSPDEQAWLVSLPASTLHRLLGLRRGTSRSRYGADEPLPYDVVVVDEASMLSLSLFARLLVALRPTCRLVLVGDPDQLTAVEAGAVLADLVEAAQARTRAPDAAARLARLLPHDPVAPPGDGVVVLTEVHRQAGILDELTKAVKAGDADAVLEVLGRGDAAVRFFDVSDDVPVRGVALDAVRELVVDHGARLRVDDPAQALAALDGHRLLCAHHTGPRGIQEWSGYVRRWLDEPRDWFAGCPVLVTENDYDNELLNGDTGVVVVSQDGELRAAFPRSSEEPRLLPLGRLGAARPMHAVTVHRSQGSQFDAVTVVLPPASSPLGTRETLYTAVSRAKRSLVVIGSEDAVRRAVERRSERATGLKERLRPSVLDRPPRGLRAMQ